MKAWRAAVTLVAVLAAGSVGAATDDNARPRGGGSGSSSAGERHHSGGSSSSSSSGGSYSSGSSSSSSSSSGEHSSRPPTGAQLRHPRAGTGTGHFHNGYYGGYYPYYGYYSPYYYGFGYNWYSPFYWGGYYDPSFGYGYGYGGPGPYYGSHSYGSSYHAGQVRVLVQPSQTRVYVDGYYAGVADDFDGIFQRLNAPAGGHDVSLRLEGYKTFNVKLYVPDDGTIKLQHKMERGTGEVNAGVMGVPQEYPRYENREPAEERDEQYGEERDRDPRADPRADQHADQAGERALVRLDVQPADASVYVDGVFRGTGRDLRQLRLPAGRHRIEVVRPGYRTIERDVEVAPGQTLDVGIDLDRG